jgi:hypothetical protein
LDTLGAPAQVINAQLFSGLTNLTSTSSLAGGVLSVTNGQLATSYGVGTTTLAGGLNVGIRAADLTGTANTINLRAAGAGSVVSSTGVADVVSTQTINMTSTGVESIALATSGSNTLALTDTPAAGVATDYATMTVTGSGTNAMDVSALTQTLSYNASTATGNNTFRFNTALQSNTSITGGSGTGDTIRVQQGSVVAGITATGVEVLRSANANASGTIAFNTGSSLTTLRIDGDTAEAGVLTLINPGAIATVNYIGDGLNASVNNAQQFIGTAITGAYTGTADTVTMNITNKGVTQLAGFTVQTGFTANGVEAFVVNSNTNTDAASTTTLTALSSNTLQTVTVTSTGGVNTGVITATPTAGNSALTSVSLAAVTGTAASTVSFLGTESVGGATQVIGSTGTGGTTLTIGSQQAGDVLIFTGGQGNDTIVSGTAANASAFLGTLVASMGQGTNAVNVGGADATASTSTVTLSGVGSANTITGNAGADTITVTANALGSTNIVIGAAGNDVINASATNVAITLNGGAGSDTITGGSGVDTYGQANNFGAATQSIVASANTTTAGGTVAGETLTFATGAAGSVDRVLSFTSGVDKLDVVTAAVAPTNQIGVAIGATTNNQTIVFYGSYAAGTGVFTTAAAYNATTAADALVAVGDGVLTQDNHTGYVVLVGLNQALVAADFI